MNKLLKGLYERWFNLVDEQGDIFEEEHPWLFDMSLPPKLVIVSRRTQNSLEIEEVLKAIRFENLLIEQKKPKPQQLMLDKITNTVI